MAQLRDRGRSIRTHRTRGREGSRKFARYRNVDGLPVQVRSLSVAGGRAGRQPVGVRPRRAAVCSLVAEGDSLTPASAARAHAATHRANPARPHAPDAPRLPLL